MRTEKEIREMFDRVFEEATKENPKVAGYMKDCYTPDDRRRVLTGILMGINFSTGADTKIFPDDISS